jgi:SAM-dependent methyltransferase
MRPGVPFGFLEFLMTLPSAFDLQSFPVARDFITRTREAFVAQYLREGDVVCDIGNQGKDIPELKAFRVVTLDITPDTNPDVVADITRHNPHLADGQFDALMCTEVLEHVVDPFAAVRELRRILKVGGHLLVTTPLNARIHGPIPDCWRFTEFGLKVLFRDFETVSLEKLNTPDRNLFPLEYGLVLRRHREGLDESDPREMRFQPVD